MNSYTSAAIRYGYNIILRAILQLWFGAMQDYNKTLIPRKHYGSYIVIPGMGKDSVITVPVPATYIMMALEEAGYGKLIAQQGPGIAYLSSYTGYQRYMGRWTE